MLDLKHLIPSILYPDYKTITENLHYEIHASSFWISFYVSSSLSLPGRIPDGFAFSSLYPRGPNLVHC